MPSGSALTPTEIEAIQLAYLANPTSISALARKFGRHRISIGRCLQGPAFEQLAASVTQMNTAQALAILRARTVKAAEAWTSEELFKNARRKANHHPMKALLEAMGVIDTHPSVAVQIQVGVAADVFIDSESDSPPSE